MLSENPKESGKLRPLGISTVRDRVCMTAMLVLEPIFEADLPPEIYAYRAGRNTQQAAVEVEEGAEGRSITAKRRAGFSTAARHFPCETDPPLEGDGLEPSVPHKETTLVGRPRSIPRLPQEKPAPSHQEPMVRIHPPSSGGSCELSVPLSIPASAAACTRACRLNRNRLPPRRQPSNRSSTCLPPDAVRLFDSVLPMILRARI
jgi:hypothetical protein